MIVTFDYTYVKLEQNTLVEQ